MRVPGTSAKGYSHLAAVSGDEYDELEAKLAAAENRVKALEADLEKAEGIATGAKMLGKAIIEATRESGCIWTPETDAEDWNPDAHVNITLRVGEMRIAAILAGRRGVKR